MRRPPCLWDVRGARDGPWSAGLLLLPHSGGSAQSFHDWGRWFPDEVRLIAAQYPGRAGRRDEPLATDIAGLVTELAAAVADLTCPLAVFGHSLGAFVGFELCWRLERIGRDPLAFFPSAAVPMHRHRPSGRSPMDLDDDEMLALLMEYGGTRDELDADSPLVRRALRLCRADSALAHEYRFGGNPRRLRSPIVAFGGTADPTVPGSLLDDWPELSTRSGTVHRLPGGHFYYLENLELVTTAILNDLSRLAGRV